MFPVNRVVAFLTPVFAAGAAVGSAWLIKHFPGLPVPGQAELLGAEISGATAAAGAALKWLHGHQAFEKRVAEIAPVTVLEEIGKTVKKLDPKLAGEVEAIVNAEISKVLGGIVAKQATMPAASAAEMPGA
jgi:hypothetical protein